MPAAKISLHSFILSLFLIAVLVKLQTFLPDRYYFTFSDVVASENDTQFLANPALPSAEAFCRIVLAEEFSPEAIREERLALVNSADLVPICQEISSIPSAQYMAFPVTASVDGELLVSEAKRAVVLEIIEYLRANPGILFAALASEGLQPRNMIAGLSTEAIDRLLVSDYYFSIDDVLQYMAGEDANVYQAARYLSQDTRLAELLTRRSQLDSEETDGLRKTAGWRARAEKYRAALLAEKSDLVKRRILERDKSSFWIAIILKLLPPFVAAFGLSFIIRRDSLIETPIAAGTVAFLLCWPIIILWDSVVSDDWKTYRMTFYMLYFLYVVSYFFSARLGAMLGLRLRFARLPVEVAKSLAWTKIIATTLTTLVTSGLTAFVTWTFAT